MPAKSLCLDQTITFFTELTLAMLALVILYFTYSKNLEKRNHIFKTARLFFQRNISKLSYEVSFLNKTTSRLLKNDFHSVGSYCIGNRSINNPMQLEVVGSCLMKDTFAASLMNISISFPPLSLIQMASETANKLSLSAFYQLVSHNLDASC